MTTETKDCGPAWGQLLGEGLYLNWAASSVEITQNPDWLKPNIAHIMDGWHKGCWPLPALPGVSPFCSSLG